MNYNAVNALEIFVREFPEFANLPVRLDVHVSGTHVILSANVRLSRRKYTRVSMLLDDQQIADVSMCVSKSKPDREMRDD